MKPLPTEVSNRFLIMAVLCVVYALLSASAFGSVLPILYGALVLKDFLRILFFGSLVVLLYWGVFSRGMASLSIYQQVINYLALGGVYVFLWVMSDWGLAFLIGGISYFSVVRDAWLMQAFVGVLLYLLALSCLLKRSTSQQRQEKEEEEESNGLVEEDSREEQTDNPPIEILDRVVIKSGQKLHVLNVEEILYIQASGDYVQIHTQETHFLKEDTMKYFQSHLPQDLFVRVHRSYIVNVKKILRIELYEKQSQQLALSNGDKIRTSAAGYKRLREVLIL